MDKLDFIEAAKINDAASKSYSRASWLDVDEATPFPPYGSLNWEHARALDRFRLKERYPEPKHVLRKQRVATSPMGGDTSSGFSPLKEYRNANHYMEGYSRPVKSAFYMPDKGDAPAFTMGKRWPPPKDHERAPPPNSYNTATCYRYLSTTKIGPSISMKQRFPPKPLTQCSDEAKIGLPHVDYAEVHEGKGFTFGMRHKHLDYNPEHDYVPGPFSYVTPEEKKRMMKVPKNISKKYPKMGMKLKTQREIERAIGLPEPPGPGSYVLPSTIKARPMTIGTRLKYPDERPTSPDLLYDTQRGFKVISQSKSSPAFTFGELSRVKSPENPRSSLSRRMDMG